jgi:hypothetical protein
LFREIGMNSAPLIVAVVVLLGCAALRGVNPFDKAILGLIWILYRFAAVALTIARTADSAYLTLGREYRRSVRQIAEERDALEISEDVRSAAPARMQTSRAIGMLQGNSAAR